MKVLNLRCAQDHRFEGWFKSDDEMRTQLVGGLLACPLCGDADIVRLPSAPHVVVQGSRPPAQQAQLAVAAKEKRDGDGSRNDAADRPVAAADDKPGSEVIVHDGAGAGSSGGGVVGGNHNVQARQAAFLQRLRQVIASTDDVGDRFAAEARRMHYGEAEERAIRGRATREEAKALVEEGIDIVALPTPEALKGTLQ